MNNQDLKNRLLEIISKELKIERDNISLGNSANNFTEWDSLSNVRLTLKLEKEFQFFIMRQ